MSREGPLTTIGETVPPPAQRVFQPGEARVVLVDAAALQDHIVAWEDLVLDAMEPNIFYEPWMLLPALRSLKQEEGSLPPEFALVYQALRKEPDGSPEVGRQEDRLIGFFPMQIRNRGGAFSLPLVRFYRHEFMYLCSPIVRSEQSALALKTFMDWLPSRSPKLVEFERIRGEGPLRQLLVEEFRNRRALPQVRDAFTRAIFRPLESADVYLKTALSAGHRREFGRKERRLNDLGKVQYRELKAGEDAIPWAERFLQLENSGWKGQEGTALARDPAARAFFMEVLAAAQIKGRLLMMELWAGERCVASRVAFRSGARGSVAFRIAYDETAGKYSPGALLELENIRRLHGDSSLRWQDSGAAANSKLFSHLWLHRQTLEDLLFATPNPTAELIVALMPLGRWVSRTMRAGRDQVADIGERVKSRAGSLSNLTSKK
jgi:hypothetical protein